MCIIYIAAIAYALSVVVSLRTPSMTHTFQFMKCIPLLRHSCGDLSGTLDICVLVICFLPKDATQSRLCLEPEKEGVVGSSGSMPKCETRRGHLSIFQLPPVVANPSFRNPSSSETVAPSPSRPMPRPKPPHLQPQKLAPSDLSTVLCIPPHLLVFS